jgi:hypothetical protein
MSGDGGNPPSLRDLLGAYEKSGLDSPVINIEYRTETLKGTTNSLGEYEYVEGETVTFFIGNLELPPVPATGVVTPLNMANTQDTSDPTVVNIIRLLQTLDKDGIPGNGIEITEQAKTNAMPVDFTLGISAFEGLSEVNVLVLNGGQDSNGIPLISTADAISNFEQELTDAGLKITGVWKATGVPEINVGGTDLGLLTLLPSGTYYVAESNEVFEGDGFEYGTYTFSDGVLSATTIIDTNGEIGFSSSATAADLQIDLGADTFSFPTDDSRESGDYTFTRQPLESSSIAGAWRLDDVLFVFMDNGEYVGHQPTESNDFVGFEWGTYSFNGSTLTSSTIDNSDGKALLCDLPESSNCVDVVVSASVTNDTLTLSIPEDGDFVFTKEL